MKHPRHHATITFVVGPVACGPDGVRYCAAVSLHATGGTLEENLGLARQDGGRYRVTMSGSWHEPPPKAETVRALTEARIERWVRERSCPPLPPAGTGSVDRWEDLALCARHDPDLWFPTSGENGREAKRICKQCPVKARCLQYVLEVEASRSQRGRYGIWGGLAAVERQRRAPEQAA